MTVREKHKWLLDNYPKLIEPMGAYEFIEEFGEKYKNLYHKTKHCFYYMGDAAYDENEMILLINLLYNRLKK